MTKRPRNHVVALPKCQVALKAARPAPYGYPTAPSTLGEHIRKRRMDLGLFQKELAQRLGVDDMTVNNWETGRSLPNLRVLPRVIEFLGYDPRPEGSTIGEKLRRHREGLGLSWAETAKQMGVDPATVSKWERQEDRRHNHVSIPRITSFLKFNPVPPPESSGQYVRHVRYAAGLKQEQLAAKIGVCGDTVSRWELGQSRPNLEQLSRMETISLAQEGPLRHPCPECVRSACAPAVRSDRRPRPRSLAPAKLETLGDHIRARRLDAGLSQAVLAHQLGVKRQVITAWELGTSKVGPQYIVKLTEFLGYVPSCLSDIRGTIVTETAI